MSDLHYDDSVGKEYPFINFKESLFSPSTGIFDSHAYMVALRNDFEQENGKVLLGNECISAEANFKGFEVLVNDKNTDEKFLIHTKVLINCAGINAVNIANSLYEKEKFTNKFKM